MSQLIMTMPDEAIYAIADSPEEATAELRMLAAVKLFELKELSSGAAALVAGVSRVEFIHRLSDYGVPFFNLDEEDLKQETRLA